MQYVDILFFYAFSCSVLWAYGIGLEKTFFDSRNGSRFMVRMPILFAQTLIAGFAIFELNSRVLLPHGLFVLIPMATILVCSLVRMVISLALPPTAQDFSTGERVFFFGTVFLATSEGASLGNSLAIALASVLAFAFSTVLLFSVRERIATADVRADWKGAPLILVSMGLLAIGMHSADVSWWIQEAFR
ncbi:MAG TPA: hypothetical protein PK542_01285 [Treponemataceae bacterium]|nr:hypothetical protein [Treponemataceae bacterium]HPS43099.1 hypothetical protein [Treponemataceae bacterium]